MEKGVKFNFKNDHKNFYTYLRIPTPNHCNAFAQFRERLVAILKANHFQAEIRIYWIDKYGDEIDIFNNVAYSIFHENSGLWPTIYAEPMTNVFAELHNAGCETFLKPQYIRATVQKLDNLKEMLLKLLKLVEKDRKFNTENNNIDSKSKKSVKWSNDLNINTDSKYDLSSASAIEKNVVKPNHVDKVQIAKLCSTIKSTTLSLTAPYNITATKDSGINEENCNLDKNNNNIRTNTLESPSVQNNIKNQKPIRIKSYENYEVKSKMLTKIHKCSNKQNDYYMMPDNIEKCRLRTFFDCGRLHQNSPLKPIVHNFDSDVCTQNCDLAKKQTNLKKADEIENSNILSNEEIDFFLAQINPKISSYDINKILKEKTSDMQNNKQNITQTKTIQSSELILKEEKPSPAVALVKKQSTKIYHPDPRINNSIVAMMVLGFTNEGGWLTNLLKSVDGSVPKAFDIICKKFVISSSRDLITL